MPLGPSRKSSWRSGDVIHNTFFGESPDLPSNLQPSHGQHNLHRVLDENTKVRTLNKNDFKLTLNTVYLLI